jgi:hypothetical protein
VKNIIERTPMRTLGRHGEKMADEQHQPARKFCIKASMVCSAGLPLGECTVVNISDRGAKLMVDDSIDVPGEFKILLSTRPGPSRECRLTRRGEGEVDVTFTARKRPGGW